MNIRNRRRHRYTSEIAESLTSVFDMPVTEVEPGFKIGVAQGADTCMTRISRSTPYSESISVLKFTGDFTVEPPIIDAIQSADVFHEIIDGELIERSGHQMKRSAADVPLPNLRGIAHSLHNIVQAQEELPVGRVQTLEHS